MSCMDLGICRCMTDKWHQPRKGSTVNSDWLVSTDNSQNHMASPYRVQSYFSHPRGGLNIAIEIQETISEKN